MTFVSSSAFPDLLQTPAKGKMDPLTLKSRGRVLYFSFISMDLTDRLRKERWEGVKLSESKINSFNLPRLVVVLRGFCSTWDLAGEL